MIPLFSIGTNPLASQSGTLPNYLVTQLGTLGLSPKLSVLALCTFIGFLILASGVLRSYNNWLNNIVSARIGSRLSTKIFASYLCSSYEFFTNTNSSNVVASSTTHINYVVMVINSTLQMMTSLIIGLVIVVSVLFIDPSSFAILSLVVCLAYFLFSRFSAQTLRSNSEIIANSSQYQVQLIQEACSGIRDIILDRRHPFVITTYNNIDNELRQKVAINNFLNSLPRFSIDTCAFLALLFIYILNSLFGGGGNVIVLGFLAVSAQKLLPLFQVCYAAWAQLKGKDKSIDYVLQSLRRPLSYKLDVSDLDSNKCHNIIKLNECLAFENVSFSYADSSKPVLQNLTFSLKARSVVGLLGRSGTGKSTLIDLISCLIKPSSGSIKIDGHTISSSSNLSNDHISSLQLSWMSQIAHVPQTISLIDGSILQNIVLNYHSDPIDVIA